MDRFPLTARIITITALCVAAPGLRAETNPTPLPLGQPEYEFLYDRLESLDAARVDSLDFQLGPYSATMASDSFGPFTRWRDLGTTTLGLFFFGGEHFNAARRTDPTGYESLRGGIVGRPLAKLAVYADFVLDEELAKDSTYTGKKWRGFAGDVNQAFVRYESGGFTLTAGRFASFWGPRRSLIVASHQKLDGLMYTYRWGRVAISYRLNQLDGLNPDVDTVSQFEPRYFAAHRFDFHLARNFDLGLFETVVFGGPGRQIDFFYLNPIVFFHGSQLNANVNDNTTVGLDFAYQPRAGMKLYGQWLVDDIQFDKKTRGDNEPNEFGVLLGGYFTDILRHTDVRLEYTAVTNWTFNQLLARNRYLNDGAPLGAVRGNDYDEVRLAVIRWLQPQLAAGLHLGYYRQGEGSIEADFSQPWSDVDNYAEPFPTGTVEKTFTGALRIQGFVRDLVFVDVEGGSSWVRNRDHVTGQRLTRPFVELRLSIFALPLLRLE